MIVQRPYALRYFST
jgi:acyl carrier protein